MLSVEENELLTRVGPGTPMGQLFRRFWLPAATLEELPGPDCNPIRTRILGEDLVGFRDTNGNVGFVDAKCPHRRAPLYFGRNEECGLRCVYHGWKFDVTGACVDMPSEPPESNFKDKVRVKAYPVRQYGPLFWIYMGPPDKMPELPQVEWAQQPEGRMMKWLQEANYLQGLEGNIDTAHVSYLHRIFGDDGSGLRRAVREVADNDVHPKLQVLETDYGFAYGGRRATANGDYYWRVTQWMLPTYSLIPSPNWVPAGSVWVPIDDEHSYRHIFFSGKNPRVNLPIHREQFKLRDGVVIDALVGDRNKSNLYQLDREMQRTLNYTGIQVIATQDQAMVEGMGHICDRPGEHLGTSDAAIIAARRRLLKTARDLQQGIEPYAATHPEVYRVRPLDIVSPEPDLTRLLQANTDWVNARIPVAV
ncbi:MAG: Rieske 2Fe-2S domain-containing protein [Chloroflexota bacterium]|nr:Rieske 2Fe-2S domain-containing protein [Chloroflexota bacterium]